MDKERFYNIVRRDIFPGRILPRQVEGIEAIFDGWEQTGYDDLRWLAYSFATVFHETSKTMQPIEEYGKGKGRPYGKKIKMSGVKYLLPDKIYYGRGLVQLTWYENYENMERLLGYPLLEDPDMALTMDISVKILFEGMTKATSHFGDFTGKCLEMYFNDKTEDPVNARRIINGLDQAKKIAGYYKTFKIALAV